MSAMQLHWDIFCRVVDNFGDIGVCWRLARQLAGEHQRIVRLWVDDPASLQPLFPGFDAVKPVQYCQGVEIRHWDHVFAFDDVAEVVIEAFACELPNAYIHAMAASPKRPCWVNLEYLTAESWAESCHGLGSPHPNLPLVKYFFFPGFSPKTGGLLRERSYEQARRNFLATQGSKLAGCQTTELTKRLEISLFCYDTAPVAPLLDALAASPEPSVVYVPPGKPIAVVKRHLGGNGPWQIGHASIEPIPFVAMDEYDQRLWRCDINFVRGEDSFVRAQWAGPAFVWQIYPQDDGAHLPKLEAFLDRYCKPLPPALQDIVRRMFLAWNTGQDVAAAWHAFVIRRAEIARHNALWSAELAAHGDLASSLVNFCASKV